MAADVTPLRTPAEMRLGEQYRAFRTAGPARPDAAARDAAFERFAARGLPHRRLEAWHYTDLRSLVRTPFEPAGGANDNVIDLVRAYLAERPDNHARRLVIVDGAVIPGLSDLGDLPDGVTVEIGAGETAELAAARALGQAESVLDLNDAFASATLTVAVADGAAPATRLDLFVIATAGAGKALTTRCALRVGAGAALTVVERHVALGGAESQANHALVVALGEGAVLDHVAVVADHAPASIHVGSVLVRIGTRARLNGFTLAATPGLVRRQSFVEFVGPHAAVSLNGVSLVADRAHADTTLVVTHTAPHCESREYFKTILAGESTGVYQGKVVVAPGAQKTDGKMMSRAIFLDEGASMFNKPELEIFADDVVCGHGATVGALDEDQLFYLRSRGIPRAQAQAMLLNAFAADAVELVADPALRENLMGTIEQWLDTRRS